MKLIESGTVVKTASSRIVPPGLELNAAFIEDVARLTHALERTESAETATVPISSVRPKRTGMPGFLLAGGLETVPAAEPCEVKSTISISLVMDMAPVRIAADFDLDAIARLADASGKTTVANPLGFYVATLGHSIDVKSERAAIPFCQIQLHVTLKAVLDQRTIEVARNLPNPGCSYSPTLAHYRRLAIADERIVTSRSERLARELRNGLSSMLEQSNLVSEDELRSAIIAFGTRLIAATADETSWQRAQAQAAARGSETSEGILRSCSQQL